VANGHWEVVFSPRAYSGLQEIRDSHGDAAYGETLDDLVALEDDPTPPDCQPMRRTKDHYRIYIYRALYRAVYRVLPAKRIVLVERIGPRSTVYSRGGYLRW
jgi:mRNA-degrading endonuclease RelE of RelBE toxin-antitoxin system